MSIQLYEWAAPGNKEEEPASFQSNEVHIVYASDDKFAEILGVSLVSLYENSKDVKSIIVYVLDSGITDCNKQKIETVCKTYERAIPVWIKAKDISRELSMEVAVDRGSLSQYARLFISRDIPEKLHRVLYLDCDIIVRKSIKELWNLDLKGNTVGALMDAFSKHYRVNIGLEQNDIMFNSGVMLVDLDQWKEHRIEEKLLDFIGKKKGNIQQGDQGALNAILSRETFCFEPRFNTVTIFYDFSYEEMKIYRKAPKYYPEQLIKRAVDDPAMIHYTTSFLSARPWVEGCSHRYAGVWLEYKAKSPWYAAKMWEDERPKWKLLTTRLFKALPRKFAIPMAGLMQAYGRPLLRLIKTKCDWKKENHEATISGRMQKDSNGSVT